MSTRNPTPASFIGLLVCGLILVIAGLWMEATHQMASGNVSGRGTGTMFGHIKGLYIAVVGAILTVIPLYNFIINKRKK
ncbi:MAG: hypothetical protein U0V75_18445 [Ferruginibacter sp.]